LRLSGREDSASSLEKTRLGGVKVGQGLLFYFGREKEGNFRILLVVGGKIRKGRS
jgi:hypothetical protein